MAMVMAAAVAMAMAAGAMAMALAMAAAVATAMAMATGMAMATATAVDMGQWENTRRARVVELEQQNDALTAELKRFKSRANHASQECAPVEAGAIHLDLISCADWRRLFCSCDFVRATLLANCHTSTNPSACGAWWKPGNH